jgi:hypothetical protein
MPKVMTCEKEMEIVSLHDSNIPMNQIAKKLGSSPRTVRDKLVKHGRDPKKFLHRAVIVGDDKKCNECKKIIPIKNFQMRKDGVTPHSYCRKCQTRMTKNNQHQCKRDAVNYLGGKCEICGYNTCVAALDFHHKDPNQKDFTIAGKLRNHKLLSAEIKRELDKCQLLCSNCHRELHYSSNK